MLCRLWRGVCEPCKVLSCVQGHSFLTRNPLQRFRENPKRTLGTLHAQALPPAKTARRLSTLHTPALPRARNSERVVDPKENSHDSLHAAALLAGELQGSHGARARPLGPARSAQRVRRQGSTNKVHPADPRETHPRPRNKRKLNN